MSRFLKKTFCFVLGYTADYQTTLGRFQVKSEGTPPRYIHSCPFPPHRPPVQGAAWQWAEFPLLSSRTLLVAHNIAAWTCQSQPNPLTIPSLHPSPFPVPRQPWVHSLKSVSLFLKWVHLYHFSFDSTYKRWHRIFLLLCLTLLSMTQHELIFVKHFEKCLAHCKPCVTL